MKGIGSSITRGMPTHCLLASMAQRRRSEERPDVLAVLRPLPPDPNRQDGDIQSHEEPNAERHRLQPCWADDEVRESDCR
jgi:hypothetical protein